ncbi:MFS transporter [Paenibacillus durus]|uniref:2-ketogluconate transporter n=1 Tax=Paenibacillus durus TaxID=44251 RepID=A0A089IU79_PAEDU|nr:MFS transporter [Paenibacillus durus]AIQ12539.1 2-ketogluconate transporter [Paenibacillus durus]
MISETRKIPGSRWKRILPPLLIVCIISFMDRVNVSFAISGGMDKELGMTAGMAGFAAGIFFFGYLFLQIPGGQIAAKSSGKKFIAWVIPFWAVVSILSGLVTSTTQLLVLRFCLGIAEGGMLPVVLTMCSNWFPNEERGRANAIVLMFAPIAAIITGPISGFIISISGWREMFIIEGIVSLVVLIPWLLMVSDRPQQAKWISKEEKDYIVGKLEEEQLAIEQENQVKQASIKDLLPNKSLWKLIALNFCYQSGDYGFSMWLPTMLKKLTNSGMGMVGLLSSLPWIACIAGMLLFSNLSDRTGRRREFVIIPLLGFALCLLLSVTIHGNIWFSYVFLIGAGFFVKAAGVVFWAIPPRLFSKEVAGGARGAINALGNLGGFFGPYIVGFLIQIFNYNVGVYSLVGLLVISALITATLPGAVQTRTNKKAA